MNIDQLHKDLLKGQKGSEETLFSNLLIRFRLFAGQRIYNKEDSEEVIQKSLAVVIQKYRDLEFTTSFSAWAHKVLHNEILKYYRTKGNREKIFMPEDSLAPPPKGWKADPVLKRSLTDCMKKLCQAYKRHARVLNLKYQGYLTKEICDKMNISANNLYVIVSQARSLLKLCLEKGDIK